MAGIGIEIGIGTRLEPEPTPTEARLSTWRSQLGASTRLWSGGGAHRVSADHWLTLSGSTAVDYNVACCHGGDPETLERALGEVTALRRPAIVMAAGAALGSVRLLADAGWVCIGSDPFMHLDLEASDLEATDLEGAEPGADLRRRDAVASPRPVARRLGRGGLAQFRRVVESSFSVPAELAELALPDSAAEDAEQRDPAFAIWGLLEAGRLVSGSALVTAGDAACVWSMGTPPELQGRGYGRLLLRAALGDARREGARRALLIASPAGERLYRSVGFDVVEHWQLWTRPRWVLA